MLETKNLLKATMDAGRELVRSPVGRAQVDPADKPLPLIVPIHSLGENHRQRINAHLLALDGQDRYLRFGYAATDEQIARVMGPIGIDIGARTPEETAISIVAEIIALRTGRAVASLRDGEGAIHRR